MYQKIKKDIKVDISNDLIQSYINYWDIKIFIVDILKNIKIFWNNHYSCLLVESRHSISSIIIIIVLIEKEKESISAGTPLFNVYRFLKLFFTPSYFFYDRLQSVDKRYCYYLNTKKKLKRNNSILR